MSEENHLQKRRAKNEGTILNENLEKKNCKTDSTIKTFNGSIYRQSDIAETKIELTPKSTQYASKSQVPSREEATEN